MNDNIIQLIPTSKNTADVCFKNFKAEAFIGENGTTTQKEEGDKKTPIGEFELGMAFGMHNRDTLKLDSNIKYVQLTDSMYWVSDYNSKYYNEFVDIKETKKEWTEAEHLIQYKIQYEYAIEIKINQHNIPKKGSATFIHCDINKPTAGCIAMKKEKVIELLNMIDKNTKILVVDV